ncbi:MAG: tetratricopeptide repeat protein [Leptonema sp. (in: bacteria)]
MNVSIFIISFLLIAILVIVIYFFSIRKDPIEKALKLAKEGNFLDARALIRSKLEKDPHNPKYHYVMANIYKEEGDEENYIQHLLEMYKIRKTVPEFSFLELINKIADYYYRMESYAECVKYYEESLRYNKNNVEALARLAFLYAGQEYFEKAEGYLKRLISIFPNKIEFLLAKGIIHSVLNQKEALELFEKVVNIDPNNSLGILFLGIESFRKKKISDEILQKIEDQLKNITETEVRYLFHKLLIGMYYFKKNYNKALQHSEYALQIALRENLPKEEYIIRITYACIGMLGGDIEAAHENLLILETRDFRDQKITNLSDYRMNIEEGIIAPGDVSPDGFDFLSFTKNWIEKFFPNDFIYKISGLKMNTKIDIPLLSEGSSEIIKKSYASSSHIDYEEMIDAFNNLTRMEFINKCQQLIQILGYQTSKQIQPDDNEGLDCIAENFEGKKALFKIRQWKNQLVSDIFLRNFQNKLNELKVQEGYLLSGAKLTPGGEQALQNLKKLKVINGEEFANMLSRIMD